MNSDFPVHGILPKDATEASSFLKKYPQYDGDGVVIAILDTGVDPGAPGLQTTSRNLPKVIDIVDCCGSGDVRMGALVDATAVDGIPTVKGVSGKTLKLGKWENPTGKYRVGLKRGFELFPAGLVDRMTKDRREKFDKEHQSLVVKVQTELNAWEKSNGQTTSPSQEVLETKLNLDAKLECLTEALKNYEDPGPIYDCVVFNDGTTWRAAIDLQEDGDLTKFVPLADYKLERKYLQFDTENMLNFSVKLYDDGTTLSIVTVAGSHGTHVAAISAANYPESPELNGIAPGARIVSLKIGDTRLGSMETGTGLTRALNSILENNCDVCNMSYGEDAGVANEGRWIELLRDELIDKKRVIFVSSAGNAGPALSTVGAPGGTTAGVIGVGAYVTPEMMQAEYALLEKVPERAYTWSSRPPAYDGAKGVSIYAPGGIYSDKLVLNLAAITSVPQYLLKNTQLMNGTSMSSPNACGNVALLIAACKDLKIPLSPYRLEKALINTAKNIDDDLKVGFLQVEKAFEYLSKFKEDFSLDIIFDIAISGRKGSAARGVYLREAFETNRIFQSNVNITPKFRKDDPSENSKRLDYEHRLVLVPTASYIKTPEFLLMNSGGRDFQIRVDPTGLPSGLHFAEIEAYVCNQIEKGPVFKIPVTITKGDFVTGNTISYKYVFGAGHVERRFINVPVGTSFAKLKVKAKGNRNPGRLVAHLMQMIPFVRHTRTEQEWYLPINADDAVPEKTFKVFGGVTLELCLAQFWSSIGSYEIEAELDFHGVEVNPSLLVLNPSAGYERVDIYSRIQQETVTPSASLDTLRKIIRPTNTVTTPQESRDLLINGKRSLELIFTYTVAVAESGSYTFRKPVFDDVLYESIFDSVLVMVHDSGKRMIAFGDIYPKAVKLNKGEYIVRVQIRHDQAELLEKIKNLPLLVDLKLSSPVSLSLYDSPSNLFNPAKQPGGLKNTKIDAGDSKAVFIDCSIDTLPKEAKPGDLLVGKFGIGTDYDGANLKVQYQVIAEPSSKSNNGSPKPDSPELKGLEDAIRDAKLAFVDKLAKKEEKKTLLTDLVKAYPTHVPVLLKNLEFFATSEFDTPGLKANNYSTIVQAAEAILELFNLDELVAFLSVKVPAVQTEEYKKKKKEYEEKKKQAVSTLYRKVEALLCSIIIGTKDVQSKFDSAYSQYLSLVDQSELSCILLSIAREYNKKNFASALKIVNKFLSEKSNGSLSKTAGVTNYLPLIDKARKWKADNDVQIVYEWKNVLLKALQWKCWSDVEEKWSTVRFPDTYAPF